MSMIPVAVNPICGSGGSLPDTLVFTARGYCGKQPGVQGVAAVSYGAYVRIPNAILLQYETVRTVRSGTGGSSDTTQSVSSLNLSETGTTTFGLEGGYGQENGHDNSVTVTLSR